MEIQFPQPHLLKRMSFFPIVYSWHLCWRSFDHICKGLFLGSLWYAIGLCVLSLCQYQTVDHISFLRCFKIGSVRPLSVFFFSQDYICCLESFGVVLEFVFFLFLKKIPLGCKEMELIALVTLDSMGIFTIWNLIICEHRMFFHLFVSFLVSLAIFCSFQCTYNIPPHPHFHFLRFP